MASRIDTGACGRRLTEAGEMTEEMCQCHVAAASEIRTHRKLRTGVGVAHHRRSWASDDTNGHRPLAAATFAALRALWLTTAPTEVTTRSCGLAALVGT